MPAPLRFPPEAHVPRIPGQSFLPVLGAAVALALAAVTAEARVYDPSQLPRATYVAPLAPWPAASYRPKDFTWFRKGSCYHLFYTRVRRHEPDH